MRIPYFIGLILILLLLAGSILSDSLSPFLSMSGDGFFAALIVLVVWFMRPRSDNNGPQEKP